MLYLFLFRYLKGYRFLFVIATFLSFAQVASDIAAALPLKFIPDKLQKGINPPSFLDPFVSFFDRWDTAEHLQHLKLGDHTVLGVILFSALILVVFSLLSALSAYIQLYLAAFIAQNLSARLRKQLFEQLERLSLDWHGKQKKGDLVQRVTGNIADIEKFVTGGLADFLSGTLTIAAVLAVMFISSAPYATLSIVIVPILALAVFSYNTSIKAAAKKVAKAAGEVADVAVEDIAAITVIKAFDLVEREAQRFNQYVNKTRRAGLRAGSLQAQFTPIVAILVGLATAFIIGVGAYVAVGKENTFTLWFITIPGGSIGIGTVVFFITLLGKLFQPMKDLSKLTNIRTAAAAGADRIQEVLDQAPEVSQSRIPYYGPPKLRGEITFENVFFGYMPEKLILQGINLHIPPGRKVALVGLSGGGKTTLVKLIPRFYEVTHGSVKIDGRDNRQYPLSLLRQNVSMVLQDSVLFDGTILENLKIARPHATIDEVITATRQAQIHETIMEFPDGYATLVRNQGKNFSGGQRQRLAIARALLSDAPMLLLDEPTASLDVEAEAEVLRALDKLVVGRTVLMITHRLITLGKVDEIIVLRGGGIIERGSYLELKRKGGVFADLLREQNRYNVDYVGDSIIASQYPHIAAGQVQRQVPPPAPSAPRMPVIPPPPHPVAGGQQQRPAPIPVANGAMPQAPAAGYAQNGGRQPQAYLPQKARVSIEIDGRTTREQQLTKPVLTIGRLSSNDIPVLVDRVSRRHARIRWENGTWLIEDADSLNGISYQGSRVDSHALKDGDSIVLAPRAILHFKAG